ncbi:MAG: hypothetical protein OXM55_08150 [Bdellovibrionales bacterium]|nr:hypothetical protein [Bdellovibrionales bacterium]
MKFLSSKKILGKNLIYFLIFFLPLSGFSEEGAVLPKSEESSLLNVEAQEFICATNTVSIEADSICLGDKTPVERVAVCSLYTSSYVAEALCLKNTKLSYKKVLDCYIGTDALMEQICLVGSDTSSRVISEFDTTEGDSATIIKELENIKKDMENILDVYKVKFDLAVGGFVFNNNIIDKEIYDKTI